MELEEAIRTRRTHKAYGREPVDARDARGAARPRALGAQPPPDQPVALPRARARGALARLKDGGRSRGARASSTARRRSWPSRSRRPATRSADEEDLCAAACAAYIVLLAAHGRGLAGYWRTPAVLRTPEGARALGIGDDEHAIGLLHLGPPRQEQRTPERAPAGDVVSWLD